MSVSLTRTALDLLKELTAIDRFMRQHRVIERKTFDLDDFTGAADDNVRSLPEGWEPIAVYLGTARQRVGVGNAVQFSFDGFVWSITWATAPLSTDYALIDAEKRS